MNRRQKRFGMGKLTHRDTAGLIQLSASVGWDYDEQEIRTVMSAGTIYGHKNEHGEIISSAAIIPYDEKLASIGMVIVSESYRGHGLGQELTEACIYSVPDDVTIMLIATQEGKPLYERLGFHAVTCVHKLICDSYAPFSEEEGGMTFDVLPLSDIHFEQVRAMDRDAVGADRGPFLAARIQQARQGVVAVQRDGSVTGYGLGIAGPVNMILGPIAAANDIVAARIIRELARGYRGRLRIDVPDGHASFVSSLEMSGFAKVGQPPVMIKNSSSLPTRNQALFGIAAQIFG
ncbi:GNAT family N-acetyltransferase [Paenibacillus apiarius]|uniref:GNAT family N-acetyltransferase n=1 Tax=Paenibacillus apiarius TaxID=46240 RepID=UPI003B3A38E1